MALRAPSGGVGLRWPGFKIKVFAAQWPAPPVNVASRKDFKNPTPESAEAMPKFRNHFSGGNGQIFLTLRVTAPFGSFVHFIRSGTLGLFWGSWVTSLDVASQVETARLLTLGVAKSSVQASDKVKL